jgi:flagellar P-ring protein precursor FlgI
VIVNARTGTVVINGAVRIGPAAVSHGRLTVSVSEDPRVSQPNPMSRGQTTVEENSNIEIRERRSPMFEVTPGASLSEIVRAVNAIGAAPSDLVAILEALRQAGALRAELVIL